jgi:hypothetical protein
VGQFESHAAHPTSGECIVVTYYQLLGELEFVGDGSGDD